MTSATGIRARNRAAIEQAILDTGRVQLGTVGAAALSLRAIARELGMTSSAIYRYVDSRDELLTRLIVAAYSSLARAVDAARTGVSPGSPAERWTAIVGAMRAWALEHPHEWALLYGSPVPDYDAPPERTIEAGTHVLGLLIGLLAEDAARDPEGEDVLPPEAAAAAELILTDPTVAGRGITPNRLLAGMDAWRLVLGAISGEVFDQLGELPDQGALFAATAARSAQIAFPHQ